MFRLGLESVKLGGIVKVGDYPLHVGFGYFHKRRSSEAVAIGFLLVVEVYGDLPDNVAGFFGVGLLG